MTIDDQHYINLIINGDTNAFALLVDRYKDLVYTLTLRMWIYRIAYNTSLDRLKKNRKHFNDVAIDEFTEHQVKTMDNALSQLENEERNQAIQKCLAQLPSDDAFMLTLYYFEDQSLDEISKVIGLTPNNVKVKLFRSRKKLATIMKAQLEPEIIENYGR